MALRRYYPHYRPPNSSYIEIGVAVDEEAAIHAYQLIKARKAQHTREEQVSARKPVSLTKLRFMGEK